MEAISFSGSNSSSFFLSGFSFTNIRDTQDISSVPFPPASQTLRHLSGDYCRESSSAHSWQPDSNRELLFSERKSLTTKWSYLFLWKPFLLAVVVSFCWKPLPLKEIIPLSGSGLFFSGNYPFKWKPFLFVEAIPFSCLLANAMVIHEHRSK